MSEAPAPRLSWPVALSLGALGGIASGLLGIGGGLVVVPLLATMLGVPLKTAIGSSLPLVAVTAIVAIATEGVVAAENLAWAAAALLAAGALAGSWIGAGIVRRWAPRALSWLMAAVLLLVAAGMAGLLDGVAVELPPAALEPPLSVALHVAAGLLAGMTSALFGVGGGIVAVPALHALHPDWAFQACRATSLAMILPTAIVSTVLHHRMGNVDAALVQRIVPGCLVGAVLGVLLANRIASRPLELAFAALLAISAARLAHGAWVTRREA